MATISIAEYSFDGPYTFASLLDDRPGVWAVLDERSLPPVDAGEAENVREAVESSDRYECWREHCDPITYAGFLVPSPSRRAEVLGELAESYDLPCRPE